jgi:hypothetical protein
LRRGWLAHLLFIPCALALLRGGAAILHYAADVPHDDSLVSRTLTAAFALFLLTAPVHAAAFILLLAVRTRHKLSAR